MTQWTRSGPSASTAIAAHNARIDAAREAHDDTGKAVLVHIIAKAEDTGGVIGFVALLDCRNSVPRRRQSPLFHAPKPSSRPRPRKPEAESARAVGIEAEGRAIEDKLVLAAELIEINERQSALDNARDGDESRSSRLAAPVRRTVGNKKNFAACGGEAFDRVRSPNILADGNADAHALERRRPRHRPRREHALFVEHAIIRQIGLEADRLDAAFVEEGIGVVAMPILDPRQPDENRRAAVGGIARDLLAGGAAGFQKRRLQDEVLGWIARDEEFGKHHEIGAEGGRLGAGGADARDIARDVADRAIDLREANDEAVRGGILARRHQGTSFGGPVRRQASRRGIGAAAFDPFRLQQLGDEKATSIACSALSRGSQ